MAAAEVDTFPYSKYTDEQRLEKKASFFRAYLEVLSTLALATQASPFKLDQSAINSRRAQDQIRAHSPHRQIPPRRRHTVVQDPNIEPPPPSVYPPPKAHLVAPCSRIDLLPAVIRRPIACCLGGNNTPTIPVSLKYFSRSEKVNHQHRSAQDYTLSGRNLT
eukprot:SAG11_NODE_3_length_39220_cov_67.005828_10_plen_162_part_00